MKNSYIVRINDNTLMSFYRDTNKNLCFRTFFHCWSDERILLESIQKNYTVTVSENNDIYIFCQDNAGNILLLTKKQKEENFTTKLILQNHSENINSIIFKPFISKNQMSLLYNIPNENKTHKLSIKSLSVEGEWLSPKEIDTFVENKDNIYEIQELTNSHYMAFYKKDIKENNIGFREITPDKYSDFSVVYQTAYNISDTSFLTVNGSIHFLILAKNTFSCQLVYKKQTKDGLTSSKVVCETATIENPIISIVKNKIYVSFVSNGQIYLKTSNDNGLTFSNAEIFKHKFCKEPTKASYISNIKMKEENYYLRDIYVDSLKPWDIQLIPDLINDFFVHKIEQPKPIQKPQPEIEERERITQEDQSFLKMSTALNDRIKKLELEKQASEKMEKVYVEKINLLNAEIVKLTQENKAKETLLEESQMPKDIMLSAAEHKAVSRTKNKIEIEILTNPTAIDKEEESEEENNIEEANI